MIFLILTISICLIALSADAREIFVAPDGTPDADGSSENPIDLATSLSAESPAKPGDIIWLLGGMYHGAFVSRLKGTADAPITVRQYPGHRATIDCQPPDDTNRASLFTIEGEWTNYWGFEVMCSNPKRVTEIIGSHPEDINRGGVNCQGSNVKLINLVVHDVAVAFGFWSGAVDSEIYGCLIYNNGWSAPDRGHGHAIYAQNESGIKRLVDNIMFNQFSHGIHVYGSSRASLRGFHIEGNIGFNNGSLAGEGRRSPNILVGGDGAAENITVVENYTYHDRLSATSTRLGYSGVNGNMIAEKNHFAGLTEIKRWKAATLTNNTFVGETTLLRLEIPDGVLDYKWDKNRYIGESHAAFRLRRAAEDETMNFDTWRAQTQLDTNSQYLPTQPDGVNVFIRPNIYEPGRAHIVVYNWAGQETVAVDLRAALPTGRKFRIVNAQDYFGEPVVSGIYNGDPVNLPMTRLSVTQPIGGAPGMPPTTGPAFNVFVLLPDENIKRPPEL